MVQLESAWEKSMPGRGYEMKPQKSFTLMAVKVGTTTHGFVVLCNRDQQQLVRADKVVDEWWWINFNLQKDDTYYIFFVSTNSGSFKYHLGDNNHRFLFFVPNSPAK